MLYQVENPFSKAMTAQNSTGNASSAMMQNIPANQKPGKTVGGAAMTGLSGAATGATIGSVIPVIGTAVGAIAGAVVGIGSYLFS